MPRETSAGVVVYREEDSKILYLLLHYHQEHWDLPKGHVEPGEQLEETALRETKEETGLEVQLKPDFRKEISYMYRRDSLLMSKTVFFFIGEAKQKEIKLSHEHIGFGWFSYEDALERLTFDTAKEVLKKANKVLSQKTLGEY